VGRKAKPVILLVREWPLDEPTGRSFLVKRLWPGARTYRVYVRTGATQCECHGHGFTGRCVHADALAALVVHHV